MILFIVLFFNTLKSQEQYPDSLFHFTGYTVFASDSTPIPNVHVLNLSKGTGTVSATDGSFELYVRDLDTLKISCIGMCNHYIHVNTSILRPGLLVLMMADTVLMEEVRISPLPPRRFFRYVFLDTRLPEVKEVELNLGPLIKSDPGRVPPTGITFGGPIQALYNVFNKKSRLDRKLRNNRKKYSKYLVPELGDSLVYPK